MEKLQDSSQKWSNLINLSGHSLALHKLNWCLLVWMFLNGDTKLVAMTESTIIIEDGKGAFAVIDYKTPDLPNMGHGCLETQLTSIGPVRRFHVVQVLGSDATFLIII